MRKLTLTREVLGEIDAAGLREVVGGGTLRTCLNLSDTCVSCLTYISCWITDCIADPA